MEYLGKGDLYKGELKALPFKDTCPDSLEALLAEGFVAFTLGPVYVYAGVQESILERFAGDECVERALKRQVVAGNIRFKHNVLSRCEQWNVMLDVIDIESWGIFTGWLMSQTFLNRPDRRYYVTRHCHAALLDPLAFDHGKRIPTSLDVFTVSGLYSSIRPIGGGGLHAQAKSYIDFEKLPPEPHIVKEGRILLGMVEGK